MSCTVPDDRNFNTVITINSSKTISVITSDDVCRSRLPIDTGTILVIATADGSNDNVFATPVMNEP